MSIFKHFLCISIVLATPMLTTHSAEAEVLWDTWYTVSKAGAPESYFNEKLEITGQKIKVQLNTWKLHGKSVSFESLGATAKNTALLEPLLYTYRLEQDGKVKTIDGTLLNDGKIFSVKIKELGSTPQDKPKTLRAETIPKLFLAAFFSAWINKNYNRITGAQPIEFMAIPESDLQNEVLAVKGNAYETKGDEISKSTQTRKLRIVFGTSVYFWYAAKNGEAIVITIPSEERVMKKVDKATAQKYLKSS